jgi:hypothetical protein
MGWLDKLLGRERKEETEAAAGAAESDIQSEADRREEDVAEARDETSLRDPQPPGTG